MLWEKRQKVGVTLKIENHMDSVRILPSGYVADHEHETLWCTFVIFIESVSSEEVACREMIDVRLRSS